MSLTLLLSATILYASQDPVLPMEELPPIEVRDLSSDSVEFTQMLSVITSYVRRAEPGLTVEEYLGRPQYGKAYGQIGSSLFFERAVVSYRQGRLNIIQHYRSYLPKSNPLGTHPATLEQRLAIAETWVNALLPPGYVARNVEPSPIGQHFTYEVGVKDNPDIILNGFMIGTIQIHSIMRRPSMMVAVMTNPPKYDPTTVFPKIPAERLEAEARRVFYLVEPRSGGLVNREYTYIVPSTKVTPQNERFAERRELTQDHYRQVEENQPSVFYRWQITFPYVRGKDIPIQTVLVDARTGRAMSWAKWHVPEPSTIGPSSEKPKETFIGSWRTSNGAVGQLTPTSLAFPAASFPVFLTDPKGRLHTVAYDPKAGLIKVEDQVLKVDPILRKALPTAPPKRGQFGRPAIKR